jgi:hypothetical protein
METPGSQPAFPSARLAVAGLLWLALFSLLYTTGDETGAWPRLPAGTFQGLDSIVGFAAGVAVLVALLWRSGIPGSSANSKVPR